MANDHLEWIAFIKKTLTKRYVALVVEFVNYSGLDNFFYILYARLTDPAPTPNYPNREAAR